MCRLFSKDGTEAYFDNFRVGEAVPYCKANIVRLEVDGSGFPESSCKYTLEFNDNSTSIGQEVSDKWSGMSAAADRNADLMKAFLTFRSRPFHLWFSNFDHCFGGKGPKR